MATLFWNRLGVACLVIVGVSLVGVAPANAGVSWTATASTPNATALFETPENWAVPDYDPIPSIGPELRPPGADSTWFIEGATDRDNFRGTITLSTARDGSGPNNPKIGAGSVGGGRSDEVTTLIISNNVTFTGAERSGTGDLSATVRQFRLGQQDWTDDNVFPWGIVKQTHGHALFEMAGDPTRGDLLITNDKVLAAGGIWEVGGDASLDIATDMQMGNKVGVRAAGGIFRVRGSNVGTVTIGDRFQVQSQTAVFDTTEVDLGGGFRHQFNRGKSVVEFVLDANGVSPITVEDNLSIGSNGTVTTPTLGTVNAILPGFLRVKLSQPTTKGSGVYDSNNPGAGDVIVLFEADRIDTAITAVPTGAEELLSGRFFGPDHTNDAGTSPHRALLDGFRLFSDYAGQRYSWQINYFESGTGIQDGEITPAVILSGLQIMGTAGDLNGDTILNEADRTALANAIANPPVSAYNLIGAKQNIFDLNADDVIDSLDMSAFNTYFLPPAGLAGDFNGDDKVDAADYTVWRNNLNSNTALPNDNGLGTPIRQDHYSLWKTNFGMGTGGAGSVTAVPEPSSILMALLCVAGVVGLRRLAA